MAKAHSTIALDFSDPLLLLRLALCLVGGAIIAGVLTLLMHTLIAFSQQELVETGRADFLDFVRVKREESSLRKKPKPQRPETKPAPPAPPTPQTDQQNLADATLQVSAPTASVDVNVDIGGIAIDTADGEYLPIVKVAPAYPVKAAVEGIEGSCLVEYTVTSTGATKDIRIIADQCERVFARASMAAAKKFKYKPRVVNGQAIEVPNVRNRFDFSFEDEGGQ